MDRSPLHFAERAFRGREDRPIATRRGYKGSVALALLR